MRQIDFLLPFGLPPAELARDLGRDLAAPALATMLARSAVAAPVISDDFGRALPHEQWLAQRFGLARDEQDSPAVALALRESLRLPAATGTWFVLQPVNYHIARDHLVLTDQRLLNIAEGDSRDLFASAQSLFKDNGMQLEYGTPELWFLQADALAGLQTATPDAACGHNIDIWLPKGEAARSWRKLQNEIQMQWHESPVNQRREARGQKPVNSLWLWGAADRAHRSDSPYSHLSNLHGWTAGLGKVRPGGANVLLGAEPQHALAAPQTLLPSALASDWGYWREQLLAMEHEWFAPLLDALKRKQFDKLRLLLTDNTRLVEHTVTRGSLRKFWLKPSFARLQA